LSVPLLLILKISPNVSNHINLSQSDGVLKEHGGLLIDLIFVALLLEVVIKGLAREVTKELEELVIVRGCWYLLYPLVEEVN
jgi:hypothetical protein